MKNAIVKKQQLYASNRELIFATILYLIKSEKISYNLESSLKYKV